LITISKDGGKIELTAKGRALDGEKLQRHDGGLLHAATRTSGLWNLQAMADKLGGRQGAFAEALQGTDQRPGKDDKRDKDKDAQVDKREQPRTNKA
jgi:hypothetical protein